MPQLLPTLAISERIVPQVLNGTPEVPSTDARGGDDFQGKFGSIHKQNKPVADFVLRNANERLSVAGISRGCTVLPQ